MSKQFLLNTDVVNLVVEALVGPSAINQYQPQPIERCSQTLSNVLYTATDANKFPPIIILITCIASQNFLHRVIQYCEQVNLQYDAMPLVQIFVTERIQSEIISYTTKHSKLSFLIELPSFPWAKNCSILSKVSVDEYESTTPLHPLVALGTFLITQKPTLLEHKHHEDPTVQQLYSILNRMSKETTTDKKVLIDDFLKICDDSQSKFEESIKLLTKLRNSNAKKRAIDCLNDGLSALASYKRKYTPSHSREPSPSGSPLPTPSISRLSQPATNSTTVSPVTFSGNWEYVENFMQSLGKGKMNWKGCFSEGQRQGYFASYTTPTSLKNSYQRWKKQHPSHSNSRD